MNDVPDSFISLEWELPLESGWYEVLATVFNGGKMCREIREAYYGAERGHFNPVPGALYVTHFRLPLPDEADIIEFHKREEMGAVWI